MGVPFGHRVVEVPKVTAVSWTACPVGHGFQGFAGGHQSDSMGTWACQQLDPIVVWGLWPHATAAHLDHAQQGSQPFHQSPLLMS